MRAFSVLLFSLLPLSAFAGQSFVYSTRIKLMPKPQLNVDADVDRFLKRMQEGDGLSTEDAAQNREGLKRQFLRQKNGFEIRGTTRIEVSDGQRYVETIVPDLATGAARGVKYLVSSDDITFEAPLSEDAEGRVMNGDTGNALGQPADRVILGGVRDWGKLLGKTTVGREERLTHEIKDANGNNSWLEIRIERGTRKLVGASSYLPIRDGKLLSATYEVSPSDGGGMPKAVVVRRYAGKRVHQVEEYALQETEEASARTYSDVLKVGMKVVDTRLGTDPQYQASYKLEGPLPTKDELERLVGLQTRPRSQASSLSEWSSLLPASGMIVMLIGAIGLYNGNRRSTFQKRPR